MEHIRWCLCCNNCRAAYAVAAFQLVWMALLALVLILRLSVGDTLLEAFEGIQDRRAGDSPAMTVCISIMLGAVVILTIVGAACLFIGLKKRSIQLLRIWIGVTIAMLLLIVVFFLLPLAFGESPNYAAVFDFLIYAWFLMVVLGAEEELQLDMMNQRLSYHSGGGAQSDPDERAIQAAGTRRAGVTSDESDERYARMSDADSPTTVVVNKSVAGLHFMPPSPESGDSGDQRRGSNHNEIKFNAFSV